MFEIDDLTPATSVKETGPDNEQKMWYGPQLLLLKRRMLLMKRERYVPTALL